MREWSESKNSKELKPNETNSILRCEPSEKKSSLSKNQLAKSER